MNSIFPANKQQFLKTESTDVQDKKFQRLRGRGGLRMTFCYSFVSQMRNRHLTRPGWNTCAHNSDNSVPRCVVKHEYNVYPVSPQEPAAPEIPPQKLHDICIPSFCLSLPESTLMQMPLALESPETQELCFIYPVYLTTEAISFVTINWLVIRKMQGTVIIVGEWRIWERGSEAALTPQMTVTVKTRPS